MMKLSYKTFFIFLLLVFVFISGAASAESTGTIKWVKGFPQRPSGKTILMWEPVPGVGKYSVVRTETSTKKLTTFEIKDNYFTDNTADPEKNYSYQVTAYTADSRKLAVSEVASTQGEKPLEKPKWDKSLQDGSKILMSWKGDPRSVFYNLYKVKPNAPPKIIGAPTGTKFVDSDIVAGEKYSYHIKAVDQTGKEGESSDILDVVVEGWLQVEGQEVVPVRYVAPTRLVIDAEEDLSEPTDIAMVDENIHVSDLGSSTVKVINTDGRYLRSYAIKPLNYMGPWGIPWGIDADPQGRRYAVAFMKTDRLRVFNVLGDMILDFKVLLPPEINNKKDLGFVPPPPQVMDVAIDSDGGFWATEYNYGQIIHFNDRGREIGRIGKPKMLDNGGPFKSPTFVAFNGPAKEVDVVDSLQSKVFVLAGSGEIKSNFKRASRKDGTLSLPKGICVNPAGELLIVDGLLSTLQAFDKTGKIIAIYQTDDPKERPMPQGMIAVAVNRNNGDIYVTSKVENCIYRLRSVPPPQK